MRDDHRRLGGHDDLAGREPAAKGSERGFGLLFAAVFAAVGLYPAFAGGAPRIWALAAAGAVLAAALARPEWLAPANRIWHRIGAAMHRVASPVVMAAIFFVVVTPTGLAMRALGKDPLRLRRDPDAESYWIHRDPPGPERESMKNQF